MVDAPDSSFSAEPTPPTGGNENKNGLAAFVASTTGKLVIGGVALVAALAIVGAIVYVFLLAPTMNVSPDSAALTGTPAGATGTNASTVASAAPVTPVNPPEKPLESDFTFRNVFSPTVKPEFKASATTSSTAGGSSTTSGTASTSVPANTLFLSSVQSVNGTKTATFIWNDKTYVLSAGQIIEDTPWKVVEIGESSVVMLYGDTEVTLTTGQGLSK